MRELVGACGIWLLPGGVVTLWLTGFGGLLLLGVTPLRYATGGALRIFPITVATHALFSLIALRLAADLSDQHQNPSDALGAAGVALVLSGLVAVVACWLGRSWTPKPRTGKEPPAAINWQREGRRGLKFLLVLTVLVSLLVLSAPVWAGLAILLLILSFPGRSSWSVSSLEVGFSLAALLALAVYVWLSTGKRGAQRAPVSANFALPLGVLCCLCGVLLPILPSFADPALPALHDGALFELLRDSAARDNLESFEGARRELERRPADRARTVEAASRKLRAISAGSSSMSGRLAAHERPPPSGGNGCNNFLGDMRSPSLTERGPPELAVIDVLLARGATQEAWAWLTDSEVPLALRGKLIEQRSMARIFPRVDLIAVFGKACVEARKHAVPAGSPGSRSEEIVDCRGVIEGLLPRERNTLTAEQGFAAAYALVAVGESLVAQHTLSGVSGDVGAAMLRGIHAAELRDATRGSDGAKFLECSTLAALATRVCPAERVPDCATDGARHSFADLQPCLAQLPPETAPDLLRLGGY